VYGVADTGRGNIRSPMWSYMRSKAVIRHIADQRVAWIRPSTITLLKRKQSNIYAR